MSEYGHVGKGSTRGPSLKGRVMLDITRGVPRARKWPKKRKKKLDQHTVEQMEWFRQAQWGTKWMEPAMQAQFREAVKGTPLLPRDLMTMMMAGRLAYVSFTDGTTMYSRPMRDDMSYSLDVITNVPGSFLVRGVEDWEGLPPSDAGFVMTSGGPGAVPQWAPAGGGASNEWVQIDLLGAPTSSPAWVWSTAVNHIDAINLGAFSAIRIYLKNVALSGDGVRGFQVSTDNGATWKNTTADYRLFDGSGSAGGSNFIWLQSEFQDNPRDGFSEFSTSNGTGLKFARPNGANITGVIQVNDPINAIRIMNNTNSNMLSGELYLYGQA